MKRFLSILAMLLIGFAGMAAEKADYTQSNAPPGDACFNLVIENSQVAVVNAQVDVVVIYHFSAAVYPAVVCEALPAELHVSKDVIQPPETATSNVNLNYSEDFSCENRFWIIHKISLNRETNFLEPTVRNLPVPFD